MTRKTFRARTVPALVALGSIALAVYVNAGNVGVSGASDGGDPGGRIMKSLEPLVKVIPGFSAEVVPWVATLSWPPPANYAIRIGPVWDSCDGMARTFGWDPVIIQVGFQWHGDATLLKHVMKDALRSEGFIRDSRAPSWDSDGGAAGLSWIRNAGRFGPTVLGLAAPIEHTGDSVLNHQWMAIFEARPDGRGVTGC